MDDDWDLQAVVRGFTTTTATAAPAAAAATATTTTTSPSSSCDLDFESYSRFQHQQLASQKNDKFLCFQDPFELKTNETSHIQDFCDLYNPFFTTKPFSPPLSSSSSLQATFQDLSSSLPYTQQEEQKEQHPQQKVQPQKHQLILPLRQTTLQPKQYSLSTVPKTAHTQSSRPKRRKNQLKRVCQVPAEGLSSDMWSWRKYGQKPIKGSPYPRGYYRCSTSKGCLARKQVERNRSDPTLFIVTYTAEHNHPMPTHRNALAGSTRQKPTNSGEPNKPTSSPPVSPAANLSPAPERLESSREERDELIEDDDDEFGITDMPLDYEFFTGLDVELVGPGPALSDCFSDHFPGSGQLPWLASNVTTTAAGGG